MTIAPSTRPATLHRGPEDRSHPVLLPRRFVDMRLRGKVADLRYDNGAAGPNALDRPGKELGDQLRRQRGKNALNGPGVAQLNRIGCQANELSAIDVQQQRDLPQCVGDRAIDLGRRQIDETCRQLRQQPFECKCFVRNDTRDIRPTSGRRRRSRHGGRWIAMSSTILFLCWRIPNSLACVVSKLAAETVAGASAAAASGSLRGRRPCSNGKISVL